MRYKKVLDGRTASFWKSSIRGVNFWTPNKRKHSAFFRFILYLLFKFVDDYDGRVAYFINLAIRE